MSEIIHTKASVLVLSAGKSGCDMIQAFQIAGYENVTWLCRETYWFWRHDAMFHDRSVLGMLRPVCCLLCGFLCTFLPELLHVRTLADRVRHSAWISRVAEALQRREVSLRRFV